MRLSLFPRQIDPYRVLFPAGIAFAFLATLVWTLFYSGLSGRYPGALHAGMMMGGFQLCLAGGFLMTAIPRFTGTSPATRPELAFALYLALGLFLVGLLGSFGVVPDSWFTVGVFVYGVFLSLYFLLRLMVRSHNPPASFIFVGVGLFCAVAGSGLMAWNPMGADRFVLGRSLLYHGMMLSLVVGVGTRLVTANLGWMENPIIPLSHFGKKPSFLSQLRSSYLGVSLLAILFIASFFIEIFHSLHLGRIVRALIATWMIMTTWRLYRLPKSKTRMALWLWVSGWLIFTGMWLYSVVPSVAVDGAHLMFIGGFTLMVFMIASRVTLSHGGFDLSFEDTSPVYSVIGSVTAVVALIRFLAGIFPEARRDTVLTASALLLITLGIWSATFLGKVLIVKSERK